MSVTTLSPASCMRDTLCLTLLGLLLAAGASATVLPNPAGAKLINKGFEAAAKGEYPEALERFDSAVTADPSASLPVSAAAQLFFRLAEPGMPDAKKYLAQARTLAQRALTLDASDPLAREVLRALDDIKPAPLRFATQDVARQLMGANADCEKGNYEQAAATYQALAIADPALSAILAAAANCDLKQHRLAEAEQQLRKAVALESHNSFAWRTLAEVLLRQQRAPEALDAMFSAIGAQPGDGANWDKLAEVGAPNGLALKPLKLVRRAYASLDPETGKMKINIDRGLAIADIPTWTVMTLAEGMRITGGEYTDKALNLTAFQRELRFWDTSLNPTSTLARNYTPVDPAILRLKKLATEQQLEAGLLLLTFKESYRADFEAWKLAHPDGVKHFIQAYGLRP